MSFVTTKSLPRRTVLRGFGAALALPFLDAMVPAFAPAARAAGKPAHRFLTFYVPNGMAMEHWTPKGEGAAFELSPILEPLAPFRDQVLVLSGLKANWNYIHAGASGSFLTRHLNIPIDRFEHCNFTSDEVLASFAIMLFYDGLLAEVSGTSSFLTAEQLVAFEARTRAVGLLTQRAGSALKLTIRQ